MTTESRKYAHGDLEPLKQLLLESGYPVEFDELRNNIDAIYKHGGIIIIAEKDKKVVGCICVVLDVRLGEGLYAEIASLIVSEEMRGEGIGKALMKHAEAWAGKRVNKIRVRANEIRTSTHAFYKHQGYCEVKTQKVFIKHR